MIIMKRICTLILIITLAAVCIVATEPVSATSPNFWAEKAPMQVARSGLGVAVVDGKIYAIGGTTYSGGSGDINGPLPSTGGTVGTNEMYDPETDTWVFKRDMPTPRSNFGIAVFQNKIYCIGGAGGSMKYTIPTQIHGRTKQPCQHLEHTSMLTLSTEEFTL
jgi:hypothetical protein